MNAQTAIAIGNTFLIEVFQRMNNAPGWGYKPNSYCSALNPIMDDEYTFQEICENNFDGDLDECLDVFFKRTIITIMWFSDWIFEKGYFDDFEDHLNDLAFVSYTFDNYINQCSIDDLKEILGLNIHQLK
jgi:hypothetical protein